MARIAVIGTGAVGAFYGAQFAVAGHEVGFLARRDAAVIARDGLTVLQAATDAVASTRTHPRLHLRPLVAAGAADLAGPWDWLLVTLKSGALADLPRIAGPLLGRQTRVIVACNGYGVDEVAAAWCGRGRVCGLLLFVCVNRDDDGTIRHIAHGQVAGAALDGDPATTDALMALCRSAGIRADPVGSLLEARWRKLVWNIPYNGLSIAGGAPGRTTDAILGDPALHARSIRLMDEVIATANADLAADGQDRRIESAWRDEQVRRTGEMGAYAPSTLLDLRARRPLETGPLFHAPLARARTLGVPTPELERLVAELP